MPVSPAAAIAEEVAGDWLKDILGIPATASFGFVTGCQMASTTALAAARHRVLSDRGWDVADRGLCGAPRPRVLMSRHRHESIIRAVRFLGLGSDSIELVPCEEDERISVEALAESLDSAPDQPAIVCLSAGDVNAGIFDPLRKACEVARARGAWVHIDGAFGLWVAATAKRRHLLDGYELADSWATDAHKWLNVPYDSGLVFVADPDAHRAGLEMRASYLVSAGEARDQIDWNPEFSRRGTGVCGVRGAPLAGAPGGEADGRPLLRLRVPDRFGNRRTRGGRGPGATHRESGAGAVPGS